MRKFLIFAILAAFTTSMFNCGPLVIKNTDIQKWPLAVSDKAPAFLFPVNLNHAGTPGNNTANGLAVTAAIALKYGKTVVSGQQLFDLVGNLSWELAEEIEYQATHGNMMMNGRGERVASSLAGYMNNILNKLADFKLIERGFKFKYIIALHSHGSGATDMFGKATKYGIDSWGGIYDVDTKQICSYLKNDSTIIVPATAKGPAIEAIVGPQLGNMYNGIIGHLISGD